MSEPTQPPEAELIERLRTQARPKLSVRGAAKSAEISDSRWRQIIKGYRQETKDVRVPVRAPADTLARMAKVVGATPEQLREVGREDAADELEAMGNIAVSVTGTDSIGVTDKGYASFSHAAVTHQQLAELDAAISQLQTAMSLLANAHDNEGLAVLVGARSTIGGVIEELAEVVQSPRPAALKEGRHATQPADTAPPAQQGTPGAEGEDQKTGAGSPRGSGTDPEGQAADDARPNVWREEPERNKADDLIGADQASGVDADDYELAGRDTGGISEGEAIRRQQERTADEGGA